MSKTEQAVIDTTRSRAALLPTVPSNHTHADAELVERARIYRYLLARAEGVSSTLASLALEQAAEAIDAGEHHAHHAALLGQTQPEPVGGWGDCWAELIEAAGPAHPLRDAMVARRAAGVLRYGQPLRRDDGRDPDRDLLEELLDAAVYAQRLGRGALALELLTLASDPQFHDEVLAEIASDAAWSEEQPISGTAAVLTEVRAERLAQDAKWGEQNHPWHGDVRLDEIAADLEGAARQSLERGPTWGAILVEEVCEALREVDADSLRAELLQVAAVAVAAVECMDRRSLPVSS